MLMWNTDMRTNSMMGNGALKPTKNWENLKMMKGSRNRGREIMIAKCHLGGEGGTKEEHFALETVCWGCKTVCAKIESPS